MALKGDRQVNDYEIRFFMNEVTTRGRIVGHGTSGSGASMDQETATAVRPTGGVSGFEPIGMLLCDVVNLDLTRQHLNHHQDEVQLGGKVTIMTDGWAVTNCVSGTPSAGDKAYFDTDGNFVATQFNAGVDQVGRFMSKKDADGYASVKVKLN
jgi:hypothetical protein